ncbi:hypothetical protein [Sutcliffiella halmapala]|uniref:hypothetical protein n=1 Tax=Sutcliffiella halmapala TaxID=79882 RepID=UPI0009958C9E|nr:hypothetical protein [Sutcliffiella halmapala]
MKLINYILAFAILIASTPFHLHDISHPYKILAVVENSLFIDYEKKGTNDGSDNTLHGFSSNIAASVQIPFYSTNNSVEEEQLPSYSHYLVTIFYQGNYMNSLIDHLTC